MDKDLLSNQIERQDILSDIKKMQAELKDIDGDLDALERDMSYSGGDKWLIEEYYCKKDQKQRKIRMLEKETIRFGHTNCNTLLLEENTIKE